MLSLCAKIVLNAKTKINEPSVVILSVGYITHARINPSEKDLPVIAIRQIGHSLI